MHEENLLSAINVWQSYVNGSVEPARSRQRRIEQLFPVRGSHHDHVAVCAEAIHLDQQLVQGIISFVIAAQFCCVLPQITGGGGVLAISRRGSSDLISS